MPDRTLIRGDSYATRRPLYRTQFYDTAGLPLNLTGCTIRTTYRPAPTAPIDDPNDSGAVIRHTLSVGTDGVIGTQDGLFIVGVVADGLVEERFTAAETRNLPLAQRLLSDIELTDARGEVTTWIMQEGIVTVDGYTHRVV